MSEAMPKDEEDENIMVMQNDSDDTERKFLD